ncbi:MAG: GNAT family N-acetyltransferase [Promethearchaeati archaeon]
MKFKKGYSEKIDTNFSIHIAEDNKEQLEAIINLNMEVHHEEILNTYIRRIFLEHPTRNDIMWLYIKDDEKNRMVSSLCLAPLKWQIENIDLNICEMEFVGTIEKYRGRGFIRILNQLYERIMREREYIFSVIRGIPFYYRKLGYVFVSSLDERIQIPISNIPHSNFKDIKIRKANINDLNFIQSKYYEFYSDFYIFNKFDPDCFKFKYLNDIYNAEIRSTYILEKDGKKSSYFSLGLSYDNQCYEIVGPNLNQKQMNTLLQYIIKIANYSKEDLLILSVSETSSLFNHIKSLGGTPLSSYGWQVKIPDLSKFFQVMKKILEKRLANSEYKTLNKDVIISDYQETVKLIIKNSIIETIFLDKGYPDLQNTDLRIPNGFLYKLLLGDRTFEEINYILKDAIVKDSSESLIEIMFPKKTSYFSSDM